MAATEHAQLVKNDTREFLALATLQLLEKQPLNELSVAKVCQRAGVSRMAFYRNFESLDDILYQYYQPKISAEFTHLQIAKSPSEKMTSQYRFFEAFGDQLLSSQAKGFEFILKRIFIDEIKKFYLPFTTDTYWISFMANGVYEIWHQWLLDDKQRPLSEIHALIQHFNATMPA